MLQLSSEAAAAATLHKFDAARLLHNPPSLFFLAQFFCTVALPPTDHLFPQQLATFFTSAPTHNWPPTAKSGNCQVGQDLLLEKQMWVAKSHQCFIQIQIGQEFRGGKTSSLGPDILMPQMYSVHHPSYVLHWLYHLR